MRISRMLINLLKFEVRSSLTGSNFFDLCQFLATFCHSSEQLSSNILRANRDKPTLVWDKLHERCASEYLPAHGNSLHGRVPWRSPGQGLPPNAGRGLSQLRNRFCSPPPHVTVHSFQSLHSDQLPFTEIFNIECERDLKVVMDYFPVSYLLYMSNPLNDNLSG